ncbi:helix-turn-helix domain-containing protein [Sphingobium sp. CR28]|uniref:helix-turn-helix domain-containing protein n=1 Tax=Sphingobium sp. CR28 TaxID=3400272 RepID=UPI003FEF8867
MATSLETSSIDQPLEAVKATVKEKWQGAVTAGSGFVAVPVALLKLQSKYDLTPTELLVLINLLAHWWEPDRPVYPRSTTIAKRMDVQTRTVQRALAKLEKRGLLERATQDDGRRVFLFDKLAKKIARDVTLSWAVDAEMRHRG